MRSWDGRRLSRRSDRMIPVADAASAVVDKKLWVVNGLTEDGRATRRVSAYSSETGRWSAVQETHEAVSNSTLVSANGRVFRLGGLDNAGVRTRATEEYDRQTKRWLPAFPLAFAVSDAIALADCSERILLIGGGGIGTCIDNIPTSPIQRFNLGRWIVNAAPAFSEFDVYNGSAGAAAPRALAPGGRAILLSCQ